MIGSLSGVLREKNPPGVLLECGGVGYEVQVPMSTFYQLPEVGAPLSLLTHLVVREDAQLLYGFASAAERRAFRALIRVSGVGPRMALSVLSSLEVAELEQAVARQEVARLIKVPGIGRKTAERLLLELKGKLLVPGADASPATARTVDSGTDDIIEALLALGWAAKEASSARAKLPPDVDVGEGIRLALRALGR